MRTAALHFATILGIMLSCLSCSDIPDYNSNLSDTYECLWTLIDEHYCYFAEKDIDWEEAGRRHRAALDTVTTWRQAFTVCSELLDELRDGHVNLSSPFGTSYYRKWWSDYPQDFDSRTLQQYYLEFDYWSIYGLSYKILDGTTGYIRYPSFSVTPGDGNLDIVLSYMADCTALIIDIRDNGGGDLDNVHKLVGRFIDKEIIGGYMIHKTGPGHDEFSRPYPVTYKPAASGHIHWPSTRPVYILTNRSCFSAANDFVAVMHTLPNVTLIGARTGGGGAMPFTYDLPNGWALRISVSPLLDAGMQSVEQGISPSPGCEVTAPAAELAAGHDAILDFALERARNYAQTNDYKHSWLSREFLLNL